MRYLTFIVRFARSWGVLLVALRFLLVALCALPFMTSCARNDRMPPSIAEQNKPSPEAEQWLTIAEDEGKDLQDRIKAVQHLERLKEEGTVPRLVKLLPNSEGYFTLRILAALGEIKSPEALPILEKMYHDKDHDLIGQVRSALSSAIRECGGDPHARR